MDHLEYRNQPSIVLFKSLLKVSHFDFVPRVFYLWLYKTFMNHFIAKVVAPIFTEKLHTFSELILNYYGALDQPQNIWEQLVMNTSHCSEIRG